MQFNINMDVSLSMTYRVDARNLDEALDKIEGAWSDDSKFVEHYLMHANVEDWSAYEPDHVGPIVDFEDVRGL